MHLAGPQALRLLFHVFVVIVGVLILSGAVNTSMIGANGVMNRLAEDGVLLDWFRKPHRRFGTTYRIINLIAVLQVATIVASRGDVYLLGEAYAFGVVWSFFLKSLGVLVLRYHRNDQEYKTPVNLRIGRARNSRRADRHHADPVVRGDGEPVHQADRDDLRRRVHRGRCSSSSRFPSGSTPGSARRRRAARRVQPRHAAGSDRRKPFRRGRAACWWPCGTTTAWRTSRRCWRKPTCGGTISW